MVLGRNTSMDNIMGDLNIYINEVIERLNNKTNEYYEEVANEILKMLKEDSKNNEN